MRASSRAALWIGGYLIRRTLADRRSSSGGPLAQALDELRSSPEFERLQEQLAVGAGPVVMAAASSSLTRLTERIERGRSKGGQLDSEPKDEFGDEAEDAEDADDDQQ
ncbi:MAG: hypothetical protein J2P17_32550, partial [Mycobacterium sp.]|nr:hypothetical protein [Mycobacterium sp.]